MYSFSQAQVEEVKQALSGAKTKAEFQRIMAVWLRASLGLKAREVAETIGWSENSVRQIQSRYFSEGKVVFEGPGRGGRRNENFSITEEKNILKPFLEKAERSGMLNVSEIKKAYEAKAEKPVPKSTIYRMLKRHGWRKIAPRPSHPKANLKAQEEFKKFS